MNYSTAVMLINQNIRAIKVSYEVGIDGKGKTPFIMFKTLDKTVAVGDYVVIPTTTRQNMTVVRVEEVDVEVDFESGTEIQWIVDKVNSDDNKNILQEEQKWIEALKASEKRRKREEIKKNMLEMYQDDGIEKLPIASMGLTGVAEIAHTKDPE